jgi:hypothetical protein
MMRFKRVLWLLAAVGAAWGLAWGGHTPGRAAGAYRLAYAVMRSEEKTVRMFGIDPANPQDATEIARFESPYAGLLAAFPSPHGEHALLWFDIDTAGMVGLVLYDAVAKTATDLGAVRSADWKPTGGLPPVPSVVWSPDATRFVVRAKFGSGREHSEMRVYDLYTKSFVVLEGAADHAHYHVAWSFDSFLITVLGTPINDLATTLLTDFEARTGKAQQASDLSAGLQLTPFSPRTVGYFMRSPGGGYVSFVVGSGGSAIESQFVYIFIPSANAAFLRPNLQVDNAPQNASPTSGFYREVPLWLNDHTFLVSKWAELRFEGSGRTYSKSQVTVAITRDLQAEKIVIPHFITEWARNPVTSQLAYRLREMDEFGNPTRESVQIARYESGRLNVSAEGPPGCDMLMWSPEGAWLSYRDQSQYCTEQPFMTFIDNATGQISKHQLAKADDERITWIGWLNVR